jgi:hypothetical protein
MDAATASVGQSPPPRYPCAVLAAERPRHGFVKLLRLRRSSGKRVPLPGPTHPLGRPLRARNFGPTRESIPHLFAVRRRGQQMPPASEVLGNGAIRRQKALGMTRGFEPLHATLALARRPMRVLAPVIEITTLAMLHPWENLALGRAVALQPVNWLQVFRGAEVSRLGDWVIR